MNKPLSHSFFENNEPVRPSIGTDDYSNTREVICRYKLKAGAYLVIPSTYDPDLNADFLLRIYAWTPIFTCKLVSYNN